MKHKMWSRLLSMVLAVMMITSIVPNSAFAEAASEIAASSQATSEVQVEEVPLPENTTTEEPAAETPAQEPAAETPAEEPAGEPVPTAEPAPEPAPTAEPVAEPTETPATENEQPTTEPTQAPAETAAPSTEPTQAPEATQTPEGTAVPTETPAASATPAPSESPVPSETPAPTETPEATEEPVAMNEEAYETTANVENADITVTVKVPEGALPVDAKLQADLIGEETEEYAEAEAALADEALNEQPVEYDGMIALDIRFELNGEEIEPLHPVEVTIDAKAMLPEDADPETVAVQHLEENANGEVTAVKTVADATEATGDVTVEAAQAEEPAMDMASTFAVDGFTTFAVTYAHFRYVNIYYVDNQGDPIATNGVMSLNDWWKQIEPPEKDGYELTEYRYGSTFEDSDDLATAGNSVELKYDDSKYQYRISGSDSEKLFGRYTPDYERNIYLVYEKVDTTPTPTPEPIDPGKKTTVTAGKTVILQDGQEPGGTYDLTLSVSGNRGSAQQKAQVDVLFILDRSASMNYKINSDDDAGKPENTRMYHVQQAINKLLNTISQNDSISAQYSVVSFAGSKRYDGDNYYDYGTKVLTDWTNDVNKVQRDLSSIKIGGGTNYQQGIQTGIQQLNENERDATRVVVFLSDGIPTYRGLNVVNKASDEDEDPKDGYGNGQNDEYNYNIDAAVNQIKNMACTEFYAIGVGPDFTDEKPTGKINLNKLANNVRATKTGVYTADNTEDLNKAFQEITESIQFFQCKEVTITDTMSENAVLAADANGSQTFTVRAVKGGETVAEETVMLPEGQTEQTFQLGSIKGNFTLTCADGTIKLEFPQDYLLQEGYTYSVTTAIKPSETAQTKGENYTNKADPGTGTHENELGFYSNDNDVSKVSFTPVTIDGNTVTPGKPDQKYFPKPVIQVKDTINEYPVRFYLEGIEVGAADDYPYTDAWATLNSLLSGGFANVTTADNPITGFPGLEDEEGYDPTVTGGSVTGGIKGDDNVVKWLGENNVLPAIDTENIKAVLQKLVDMYPGIEDVPVAAAGGEKYTVQQIIDNPSDFKIVYTQVTQNHDQIIKHFRGNGSVAAGQDSYHVHLTIKKNPGDLTITKSFSGIKQLPDGFAIQVSNSVGKVIETLTTDRAVSFDPETNTYTWKIENLDEDTYTVTELNAGVSGKDLSANITVTDEDNTTPVTVEGETAKVKVANAKTSTVAITNTYTDSDGYLTINKAINGKLYEDGRDVFVFKVTAQTGRDAGKVWYFSTNKAGPVVELLKLPVGKYRVEEMSNINYEVPSFEGLDKSGVVEITSDNTQTKPAVVTCTNTPKKDPGITDGSGVINKYSNGTITFEPVIIAGDVTGPNGGALPGNKEEEE